jgi:hypothetical protein
MIQIEPVLMPCLSPTLSEDFLSCVECRAFEYAKCDGCPASAFAIWAVAPKDPRKSVKLSRWIDALGPHTFGTTPLSQSIYLKNID